MRRLSFLFFRFFVLSMVTIWLPAGNGVGGQFPARTGTIKSPVKTDSLAKIPLFFVPNRGQLDARVFYSLQRSDTAVYFTSEGLTYVLGEPSGAKDGADSSASRPGPGLRPHGVGGSPRWVIKLDFIGARPDIRPEGLDRTGAIVSYFKGKPSQWKTGLPAYSSLCYRDLWPGIDLVYHGEQDKLKYEFIVHPGADPRTISFAISGAPRAELTSQGQLVITTPGGILIDEAPVAFQEDSLGRQLKVEAGYRLEPGTNKVSFVHYDVGDHDLRRTLIIDPAEVLYFCVIGGTDNVYGYDIAVDSQGAAYITGMSMAGGLPVAAGPDPTWNGDRDAFVAKIDPTGTSLVYCGYIGGTSTDEGNGIAVDRYGCAYVTGYADSDEKTFPVKVGPGLIHGIDPGTQQPVADAFVAKLTADGTDFVYCGFIGGIGDDVGHDIAVDEAGNAYVVGSTESDAGSFPVRVGPALVKGGQEDAFIAKVNPSGSGLIYCGYIGGSESDEANGIAVDASGRAYVVGVTASSQSSFPVRKGPGLTYGGFRDAFIAGVNSAGAGLDFCGYIGGDDEDVGRAIALDSSGAIDITGYTRSKETSFPVRKGPELQLKSSWSAFVAQLNPSSATLTYCGYIGSDKKSAGYGIAAGADGSAYVIGYSIDEQAQYDVLLAKVMSDATGFVYSNGADVHDRANVHRSTFDIIGYALAVDTFGHAYLVGSTNAVLGIVSDGYMSNIHGGYWAPSWGEKAFVAKLDLSLIFPPTRVR